MPDGTAATIDRFYDAWKRHDAAAVAASFAVGGVYTDPLTRGELSGDNLTDHVQSVLDVIRDLRISLIRTIAEDDAAAVVWATEGTWDGTLDALSANRVGHSLPIPAHEHDPLAIGDLGGRLERDQVLKLPRPVAGLLLQVRREPGEREALRESAAGARPRRIGDRRLDRTSARAAP